MSTSAVAIVAALIMFTAEMPLAMVPRDRADEDAKSQRRLGEMYDANEADRRYTIKLRGMSAAGVQVEPLSSQLRKFFNIREEVGVLVRSVRRDSAAEKSGLEAGDVITRVGKDPIRTPAQFAESFRNAKGTKIIIHIVRARNIEMVDIHVTKN